MKTLYKVLIPVLLSVLMAGCMKDGADYDPVTDVPSGVYITGPASQFSLEAVKGKFAVVKQDTLTSLFTWLKPGGDFRVSLVGEDGLPVKYGAGASTTDGEVTTYALSASAPGFTVQKKGFTACWSIRCSAR